MARDLNPTAASLLGFLHDGPLTGWDLVARAEERLGGFWSLTRSQVYRELARMAEEGLIDAGERGTRAKIPYQLTDDGKRAFADWVVEPPSEETIRFPLLLTIAFGRHVPPERMADYLATHRAVHAERLRRYEKQRAEMPPEFERTDPYSVATLEFGINYERSALEWFDRMPEEITTIRS